MLQEFLVLETDGIFDVYSIRGFPRGTPVAADARRLRVVGDAPVELLHERFTVPQWERWCRELKESGREVTVGPFWRNGPPDARATANSEMIPLREAFDELLREAERREQEEDRRLGALRPRHP